MALSIRFFITLADISLYLLSSSLLAFALYYLFIQLPALPNDCAMTYSWCNYSIIPILPISIDIDALARAAGAEEARKFGRSRLAYKYRLLRFDDNAVNRRPLFPERSRNVLIFIPGSAASFGQVRSVGYEALAYYARASLREKRRKSSGTARSVKGEGSPADSENLGNLDDAEGSDASMQSKEKRRGDGGKGMLTALDIYSLDFKEEATALSGDVLRDQADFFNDAVRTMTMLYRPDVKVVVVALSMGGTVARLARFRPNYVDDVIAAVFTLSTPHVRPVVQHDLRMAQLYLTLESAAASATEDDDVKDVPVVSISGGYKDTLVPSVLADLEYRAKTSVSLLVGQLKRISFSVDHHAMMWCNQPVSLLAKACYMAIQQSHETPKAVLQALAQHLMHKDDPSIQESRDQLQSKTDGNQAPIRNGATEENRRQLAPEYSILAWAVEQTRRFGADRVLSSISAAALMNMRCMAEAINSQQRLGVDLKEVHFSPIQHVRVTLRDLGSLAWFPWMVVVLTQLPQGIIPQISTGAFFPPVIKALTNKPVVSASIPARIWFYFVGLAFVTCFDWIVRALAWMIDRLRTVLQRKPMRFFLLGLYAIPSGWVVGHAIERMPQAPEGVSQLSLEHLSSLSMWSLQVTKCAAYAYLGTCLLRVVFELLCASSSRKRVGYVGYIRAEDHLRMVAMFVLPILTIFLGPALSLYGNLAGTNRLEDVLPLKTNRAPRSAIHPIVPTENLDKVVAMHSFLEKEWNHSTSVWSSDFPDTLIFPEVIMLLLVVYLRWLQNASKRVTPETVLTSTTGKWSRVKSQGMCLVSCHFMAQFVYSLNRPVGYVN